MKRSFVIRFAPNLLIMRLVGGIYSEERVAGGVGGSGRRRAGWCLVDYGLWMLGLVGGSDGGGGAGGGGEGEGTDGGESGSK